MDSPESLALLRSIWTGETMKGRKFSECPAEYLDLLAQRPAGPIPTQIPTPTKT